MRLSPHREIRLFHVEHTRPDRPMFRASPAEPGSGADAVAHGCWGYAGRPDSPLDPVRGLAERADQPRRLRP